MTHVRGLSLLGKIVAALALAACSSGNGGNGGDDVTPPQVTITYDLPATYAVGENIGANLPAVSGAPNTFSIQPPLPAGLALNSSTGAISGITQSPALRTTYVVTASNATNSSTHSFTIAVNSAAMAEMAGSSSGTVTLDDLQPGTFNRIPASLVFRVNGAVLQPGSVHVWVGSSIYVGSAIELSQGNTVATVQSPAITDGDLLSIEILALDSNKKNLQFDSQYIFGEGSLSGAVVDESGNPAPGAVVTATLSDNALFVRAVTADASGQYMIPGVPARTILLDAKSSDGRSSGSDVAAGGATGVALILRGIGATSSAKNLDFSSGTTGWSGDAVVTVGAHVE